MTRDELKSLLKAKYSVDTFKYFVKQIFPICELYITPIEKALPDSKKEIAKSINQIGACKLRDNAKIAFYEVELARGKKVAQNRVGLRNLLIGELQPGDLDGIFASFYNPETKDWRVSFLSRSLSWDNELKQVKTETSPRRYTFVVGQSETVATAVERFERLLHKAGALKIDDILEAFSVEKICDEFFDKYRHQFEVFTDYLVDSKQVAWFRKRALEQHAENIDAEAEKLARNFIKKLLGRIVFLYFLQKKGWLGVPQGKPWGDGSRDFIRSLFNSFDSKNEFFAECLVPLFFQTLNRKRDNDLFSITKTRIPYLNGGLFDKDAFEPVDTRFKANLFEDLFAFFDSYNFTIDENSPEDQDIGIDPEMLGRIFENLLEENLRSQKGTFYTPKDVVHYMCKEALRCYIREKISAKANPQELKAVDAFIYELPEINQSIIKKYAEQIDTALTAVKICDPAIGSGAFAMGMVYEILRIKKELFGLISSKKGFDYGKEKLSIIKNSIYGVDIDQGAIDIARLRFWLSLIVDEDEPRPLPNLDYKIMQGDSLREWYDTIPLHNLVTDEERPLFLEEPRLAFGDAFDDPQKKLKLSVIQKMELKGLVNKYFTVEAEEDKLYIHKQIDTIVDRHLKANVAYKKNASLRKIENGHRLSSKQLVLERKKFKEIEEKERNLIELENAVEKPFFLWNLFFGDVLVDNNGFDIVIGNPPYGVKVDEQTRDFYGLASKDSYGVFMSLGLKKLLKVKGILCFIVSDTWLTIKSHLPLRKQILEWQLQKVIRLHQDCFHATVNSCIFTVKKERFDKDKPNNVIAADYTNISTRKETGKFREKLLRVEELVGESTVEFGVYGYELGIILLKKSLPIFSSNLLLFKVLSDICIKKDEIITGSIKKEPILGYKVDINGKEIYCVKIGASYERSGSEKKWKNDGACLIVSGIKTGKNEKYLRSKNGEKNLPIVEDEYICNNYDGLSDKEKLEGIFSSKKTFIPFEMGRPSDTDSGALPNYYQEETPYFINWSKTAFSSMKREEHSDLANPEFRFRDRISFSCTGIYAPTFRIAVAPIFVNKASGIFCNIHGHLLLLALLSSKLTRFFLKNYVNHTVEMEVDDIKDLFIPAEIDEEIIEELEKLTESIITKQKSNPIYNYLDTKEQKQIDSLVYQLYNLSPSDINEVETWFARRYPKLARYADIKPPEELKPKISTEDEKITKYKSLISSGESRTVEFKQTLRYDVRTKQINKDLEWECIKNIAAFLNCQGGTLFIGVRDEDGAIAGIESDFNTFSGSNKKDAFLRHFDNLIAQHFGNVAQPNLSVEFPAIDGMVLCAVNVIGPAPEPVYLVNKQKNNQEEFYIRRSASTVSLTLRETVQFVHEHWHTKYKKE